MTEQVTPAKKPPLKQRLKKLMEEYGKVALYTYLVMSLSTIAGFSIAIAFGTDADSTGGVLGAIGAGWVAAKATMPLRILATLALTPLLANLLARWRKKRGVENDDEDDEDDDLDDAPASKAS